MVTLFSIFTIFVYIICMYCSILRVTAIKNKESISFYIKDRSNEGIYRFVFSQIGQVSEGSEREGFEPSVNKSLHSSSNATP